MAALAEINILGPVESARSSLLDPPNDQQISEQKAKPVLSADQVNNSSELSQENPHPTTALESGNNDGTVESPSAAETPPVEIERLTQERRIPEDDDTDSFVDSDDDSPMRFRFRNPHRIMRQASTLNQDQLYQVYKDRLERANRGNDKASALVKGFVDYMRSMEKRMKTLEEGVPSNTEGVDRTAGKEDSGKEDSGKEDSDKVQGNRKELLEARFYHYSNAFDASGDLKDADDDQESAFTSDKGPAYLLRVVYDSPHNASSQASEDNTAELDPNDIDLIMMTIESAPIASFFEKRLGFEMRSKHTFRVAKPFRSILMNREIIEGHLIELKRNFRTESPNAVLGPPIGGLGAANNADVPQLEPNVHTNEQEATRDPYNSAEALRHFECFVNFLHKYLAPKIDLYEKIRSAEVESIAFEDLWMLFCPGVKIYCPSRMGLAYISNHGGENWRTQTRHVPQVYHVIGHDGGIPMTRTWASDKNRDDDEGLLGLFLSTYNTARNGRSPLLDTQRGRTERMTAESSKRKNHYSTLAVTCMHMAFNGETYCTIADAFVFKPFESNVNIRSLEAYPLQFLEKRSPAIPTTTADPPKTPSMVDSLLERGKTLVGLTNFAHRLYEGLTVGMTKEEVNGAVVVDVKLAMLEHGDKFPGLKVETMDISKYWALSRRDGDEILELAIPGGEETSCHKSCTDEIFPSWQRRQRDKLATRIKRILDEYEGVSWDDPTHLETFSQRMENEELLILMPGVVPGFVLRNRNWVQLDIRRLKAFQERDDWNKLVLPPGHKRMVQAMVETHSRGSKPTDEKALDKPEMDLVRGKGKGCIILLHGVPGVGKTSTAECVAAYTGRPLYPITCGDIGYLPDEVEKNMGKHFKLAHRWACVLLLDEADVFLAKRDKSDVRRNGLVSVFLRILEYYPGILFLTTNRVGYLDDAFRSRLHLTLFYPKLNKKQTTKIWEMNLDRLDELNNERARKGQLRIDFNRKKILRWVEVNRKDLEWNGRQIRNAFQTAIALAEFGAKPGASEKDQADPGVAKTPKMSTTHLKTIAEASRQFNEYLALTHGYEEDARAQIDGTRYNDSKPTQAKTPNRRPSRRYNVSSVEGSEDEEDDDDVSDSDSESEEGISEDDEDSEESEEDTGKKGKKSGRKSKSSKTGKGKEEKRKSGRS